MVRIILKRVVALTACGCSAGNRTTSLAFTVSGLPATVTSASPSMACTSASNGGGVFAQSLPFIEREDRDIPLLPV